MNLNRSDLNLALVLCATLVLPLLLGLMFQEYSSWRLISLPLHAVLEASGAMIALVLAWVIFVLNSHKPKFTFLHRSSFAFLMMGVFDLFHAMQPPGELFVWLHTLAIFMGGILYSLVWLPDFKTSQRSYRLIPILALSIAVLASVGSILFPETLPRMLDEKGNFTNAANLMNIIGGSLFVLASFYFVKRYLQSPDWTNLIFIGHTMLFGSAGILFFFSTVWDLSWWFWHFLRLIAYMIGLYFITQLFIQNRQTLLHRNQQLKAGNAELNNANKMLTEYKSAIYKGGLISTANLKGNITSVNQDLLDLSGYQAEELIGQPHSIFRDAQTPKSVFKEMWQKIQEKRVFKGLIKNRKKDGSSFYAKITVIPILDHSGEINEYLALREDVTELVHSQKALQTHFYTDPLTGLNNRFKLHEDLASLDNPHLALLNIDNFKSLNDFYGTEFGDEVIKSLADSLIELSDLRRCWVYRNHGDEFAIVTKEFINFNEFFQQIKEIVSKVENIPIKIHDTELTLQLSGGIVESDNSLVKADIALKQAKQSNKSIVQYQQSLQVEVLFKKNIYWSQQVKLALSDDRIAVVFQPIKNNATGKIEKYEVLVRLIDLEGGMVAPSEFLEVTKHSRLYSQITRRVVQKAFQALKDCAFEVTINICAEDIFDDQTREFIFNTLQGCKFSHRVTFELVESEGIEMFNQVRGFISKVKSYGAKIAIDDFGTGYSNFDYLIELQADYIKIDGSLIQNIDLDKNRYALVETIVAFAKSHHVPIVAEFVSNSNLQTSVMSLGIDYSQGYFIGRPQLLKDMELQK